MKKLEKTVKKMKQLLRAKSEQNSQLSARVTELEIAESGDEEEETEYGEYMEETWDFTSIFGPKQVDMITQKLSNL